MVSSSSTSLILISKLTPWMSSHTLNAKTLWKPLRTGKNGVGAGHQVAISCFGYCLSWDIIHYERLKSESTSNVSHLCSKYVFDYIFFQSSVIKFGFNVIFFFLYVTVLLVNRGVL